MDWILFVLFSLGVTNIIVNEYISLPVHQFIETRFSKCKWLNKLINCTTCLGWWVGLCSSFLFGVDWWIAPFVSSIANKVLTVWMDKV